MPVPAGSLEAFATYLHSLGGAYSHADCMDALAAHTPFAPWGTHTVPALGDTSIYACDYNPAHPQNDDAHGREFGGIYTNTQRTIATARAIYTELSARSLSREGVYVPLPLTTPLTVSGAETTLCQSSRTFAAIPRTFRFRANGSHTTRFSRLLPRFAQSQRLNSVPLGASKARQGIEWQWRWII